MPFERKILDVRKIKKNLASENTRGIESEKQFWQEKSRPTIFSQPPASPKFLPWLYGVLFATAFALAVMTTSYITNRSSKSETTPAKPSTLTYAPQSKAGEKNPFSENSAATALPTPATTTEFEASASQPDTTNKAVSSIDKKSVALRVLNGNGVTGDATRIKKQLEEAGFSVSSTGNAKFSYGKTQVYYIDGKKSQADLVATALTNREVVVTEAAKSVVGDNTDVLVVVGKK